MPKGKKYPTAKIRGTMGHSAPVDTTGMDESMKRTLGFTKPKVAPKKKPRGK